MRHAFVKLSDEQRSWLDAHPEYRPVGAPRPGVSFTRCGTLYRDGRFDISAPMKVIRLEPGCIGIGVLREPN
jgi:hypothetical protein